MSRAKRRQGPGSARSRRTPAVPATGRGLRIPWIPLAVLVGAGVIVGLIAYLIWQSGQPAGNRFGEAAEVEADPAPDLPGEFVNLQEIYGGAYGEQSTEGGGNTAPHVSRDVDYIEDGNTNPPTGGPHWAGGCTESPETSPAFCGPAPWGIYREPWDPETLVHNMEHGGAVVWYNTTDQAIIDDLEELIKDRTGGVVLAPYPDMEEEYIAVTTWGRIDKFPVSEFSIDRVKAFFDAHICRFNPEDLPDC